MALSAAAGALENGAEERKEQERGKGVRGVTTLGQRSTCKSKVMSPSDVSTITDILDVFPWLPSRPPHCPFPLSLFFKELK